jgi:hypothetical protein
VESDYQYDESEQDERRTGPPKDRIRAQRRIRDLPIETVRPQEGVRETCGVLHPAPLQLHGLQLHGLIEYRFRVHLPRREIRDKEQLDNQKGDQNRKPGGPQLRL